MNCNTETYTSIENKPKEIGDGIMGVKNLYPEIYSSDVRFNSVSDVRRFLARIVNLRANEQMDSQTCRDLGYLCNILIKALEIGDIEVRLAALEEVINDV